MNDRQLNLLNLHRYRAIGGGDDITDQLRSRNSGTALHLSLRMAVSIVAHDRY